MTNRRLLNQCLIGLALAALTASPALPQASNGSVSGTVRDQSNAVIPTAPVVLTNTDTNVISRTTTSQSGFYVFPGVTPGPYRIEVEYPGMQAYKAGITVQTQQGIVVDPVLQTGQTTTIVEVRDVTPMVRVDTPTLGNVLERTRIENLPINGRNFFTLLQTIPGMEGNRAYGEREGSTAVSVDGATIDDRYRGANQNRPPGLDTVLEFSVETIGSSARTSRPATIVVSTQSGTNDVHGALFETNRNNAVGKARTRQDTGAKPPYMNQNEFGGKIAGPVVLPKLYDGRNRTFWLFSYEASRIVSNSTSGYKVPTEAMWNGD
ncbi:MAG TPA: carboxypeptidase-like regulatory domain-containing protein, partial [Bryobacteraceae bacterium]|nr:carboxypeptidase-like regulatory domain-containing protein [Bryobacteraceae bacterium]